MLRRTRLCFQLTLLTVLAACPLVAHAEDWLPVTPDELKMTSEPKAPGAPAIYLYRQVDRDDSNSRETVYARIKILTEEGRKYGDVELAFSKGTEQIKKIQARTIRPDGSIVNFDGKVYEKTIVKAKGVSVLAKTFSLPDVQPGAIIEYRYQSEFEYGYVFDSHWILSEELFTKKAKFSLKVYDQFAMQAGWPVGLPAGTNPPVLKGETVTLESQDIPAFEIEDYMPPENELKYRVDFVYSGFQNPEKDFDKFWKQFGKLHYQEVSDFIDKRKAMEAAVAQTVAPNDPPETKLRKIYARVQQIHNTSYDREKTEQELKREKGKDVNNVEDIWKGNKGDAYNLTWLFLAMARAAGFQADPVLVSTRDRYFFNPRTRNPHELNSNVVLVRLDGKDLFLDPGDLFAPYGLLPWSETQVEGIRLDKEGGSWLRTSMPDAGASRIERSADMRLDADTGSLEGKVSVTYTGLEAMRRRAEENNEDDTDKQKSLEDELESFVPTGCEAHLTNKPDWRNPETPLVAEFSLKVPGWATSAGRRALISVGLFSNDEKHVFEHANRVHPVYFKFPHQTADSISIAMPQGWQISSLPQPKTLDTKVMVYQSTVENKNGTLQLHRQFNSSILFLNAQYYRALQDFYQKVRTEDEQQIVALPAPHISQN